MPLAWLGRWPLAANLVFQGNVAFDTFFDNMKLGVTQVYDMTLQPGMNNNFSMRANLSRAPMLAALQQRPYCENGGKLPLRLVATSVENGDQALSYFTSALATANLTTVLDVGSGLKALELPPSVFQCSS